MNKKRTILILSISVVFALFSVSVYVSLFKIIENKNIHTSVVLSTLKDKQKQKESADILSEKLNEIESTQKRIKNYFVDPTKIDLFVEYLENLGTDSGVKLIFKDVKISNTDKNVMLLDVSMDGAFPNIMKTISVLENTPYQIHVTKTFLNKDLSSVNDEEKTKSSFNWQANISFSILISS